VSPPVVWWGRVPLPIALERQRGLRDALLAGQGAEQITAVEHDPVVTTGRRAALDPAARAALEARGLPVVPTERGGLATWHGPGQLVLWPLVRLRPRGLGPRAFVELLEDVVIAWCRARGAAADRRPGLPGVWVGADKLCALGLHIAQGVSLHGLALNLDPDLSGYEGFTPCGVVGGGVTSFARLGLPVPEIADAAASLGGALARGLGVGAPPREELEPGRLDAPGGSG
jgi:lipoate-protein ligase B